jgi:ketosteroid isomerase-like protein
MFWKKVFIFSYLILILILIFSNCSKQINLDAEKEAMMNTDREFSKMSVEKGSLEAFHYYLAEDGKALPQKGEPRSKQDFQKLVELTKNQAPNSSLKWEPIFADMASSGNLGYTYGKYESTALDSLGNQQKTYGYYVSIWKKQKDGTWRFVFDAGNETSK